MWNYKDNKKKNQGGCFEKNYKFQTVPNQKGEWKQYTERLDFPKPLLSQR